MGRGLLDTDVIIWHLRGRDAARRWINELAARGVPCCSSLSVIEVVLGMRPKEARATREFFHWIEVVAPDREIAWQAGNMIREYGTKGITLNFVDATIAATCMARGLVLATYNEKHYPMPGLLKAVRLD